MYILIAVAFVGIMGVPAEYLIEYLRERKEYREARGVIEGAIRTWTAIAKCCDPVEDAVDKGIAIGRLVIYYHELDELDRKRDLCS